MTNLVGSVYGKKGQFKPVSAKAFMPVWDADNDIKRQTVDEMKGILMALAGSGKGKIRKGKPRSLRHRREDSRKGKH